tara:strand:- start:1151 stop:1600 length:450 start_codon:yes stop_codon:yes gene_type:complete
VAYQIPSRPSDQAATSVTEKELDQVERVFDLLLGPIILPDGEMSVVVERTENTRAMSISLLHVKGEWLIKEEQRELAAIGASLSGLDEVLWKEPISIITILPREVSSHDRIEDRVALKSICEGRGINWNEISQCYDLIVKSILSERDTA